MREWRALLESIELGIDACEQRYIVGAAVDIPPAPALPNDLGPLPPELEPRARSVLARLRAMESKIARIPRPGASRGTRFGAKDNAAATFDHML